MRISLPQNRWHGDEPVLIDLPDTWQTSVVRMAGDALLPLSNEQIRARIDAPLGSLPLDQLARGRKSACVLFDDMSRGTPTIELAHIVLEKLLAAGIPKERIVFICALGCHGALELDDFVKKLGADICAEYPVYNHNPFGNLVEVGVTSRGFHAKVNAEVMNYDLKIGLGAIVPHPFNGFGGGAKIILPGITGLDTSADNHRLELPRALHDRDKPYSCSHGNLQYRDVREDAEEVAQLVGLDFKIDVLLNSNCQIIKLFSGHPITEYYEGVRTAFELYHADDPGKADICIVNANAKSNESQLAFNVGADHVNIGGDVVLVNFCKTGVVNHYLCGMWGVDNGTKLSGGNKQDQPLPAAIRHLIIFSPWRQYNHTILYGNPEQVKWANTWDEVLQMLGPRPAGATANVFIEAITSMITTSDKRDYLPVNLP